VYICVDREWNALDDGLDGFSVMALCECLLHSD
jgi:hypothetical protein